MARMVRCALIQATCEWSAEKFSLAQIKPNKLFADSPLVRQGRLSVVPLTEAQYKFLSGE